MASTIGTALISTILERLAPKAVEIMVDKGTTMLIDKVDGMVNIEREIRNLQTTLRMIQGTVQQAEEKQIDDDFIRNWLRDLVEIAYEARDVLEDFIAYRSCITAEEAPNPVNFICSLMLCCFGGSSSDTSKLPLAILNRLEKDIRSVRERFDEKKEEGKTFATLKSVFVGGGSESVPTNNTRPEVGPYLNRQGDNLFLGREEVKEGIMERLLCPSDNRVHVVPIWGMGGIGKTTLALSIYNDERVKKEDYSSKNRLWHSVGEDKFNAEKVIREIVTDSNISGIGKLQENLVKELKGDRFLFVLDDVWEVDGSEWNLLFNPLTQEGKGGFIIITTRKSGVINATNTLVPDPLRPLSYQHSWSIFESRAFINGNSDSRPDLKCVGEKIVEKLKGLPLALEVVGCSLLNEDASTWENFLNSKDADVMSALRWSYNLLRPPHLKYCFAYCALFPKDHQFEEKVLVEMWMAHDLIPKEDQKRPEDVGIQCFKQLLSTSLLQCVDGKYVMHDMVHDLALLVSNEEFASAKSSLTNDQMEKVHHITITPNDYSKIPRLCKMEKLLTLYTTGYETFTIEKFDYSVLDDVFKQPKSIRVLVLDSSKITDIPDCIGELRHLRYLDVSQTSVKRLPDSLCHLYHLQVLAARPDAILPKDIVNMVNLKHVRANLSTCKGVGKLTSLQELSSICVCKDDNIRELGDMQLLHGELTIQGLGKVEKLEDDVGALMEKQTLMDELKLKFDRCLEKSPILTQVLDALGCPPNLKYLKMVGYNGLKPPRWMVDGKNKFDKLQTLELSDCRNLESLPPLGELTSLKYLSLKSLHEVHRLGDEFYGNLTKKKVFFPSLESLHFYEMYRWKKWDDITIKNSNVSLFPRLTRLEIDRCPSLTSLPPLGEFTSLKHISLRNVGVKRLEDEFYGNLTNKKVFFPALESLYFSQMEEWKGWDNITINNSSVSFFPRLTRLEIEKCPKLVLVLPVIINNFRSKRRRGDKHPIMNVADFMSSLSSLKICDCEGLERLQLDALVSLKELEISSCKRLVRITSAICLATTIERLQISQCEHLETMDFERLPSLKHLEVSLCNNLISIAPLVGIKFLELSGCASLRSLSINIHGLDSLEQLNINNCPVLELILEEGSSSSSSSGNSVAVPISISTDNTQVFRKLLHHEFVSLESLDIGNLTGFENFGDTEANNFCKLMSLKSLCISQCKQLKSLPLDFHKLSALQFIDIDSCDKLQSLPPNFHKLSSLEKLNIKSCTQLQSLPPSFGKLSSLKLLYINSCEHLQSLPPDFDMLSSLEDLTINGSQQLQSLPRDFQKLSSLNSLWIESCPQLQSLPPSLGKLSSLTFLNIDSCEQLQSLPDFHKLSSLGILNIKSCPQLQSLPADFDKIPSLKILSIEDCPKIQSLPTDFHKLSSLKYLDIKSCPQLQSLPSNFAKLSSLEILTIESCPQLQSLPPSFGNLSSLEELKIKSCPQLQSLPADFHKLSSLNNLDIEDCPKIQSLPPDFHKLSYLEYLRIENEITSTRLEDCPQLQSLMDSINSLVIAYQMPLEERCKLESGHHWHQIKNIPNIYLSDGENNCIEVSDGTLVKYPVEEEEEEEEEAEEEEIPRYPYKHIKSCPQLQSLLADFDKLSSLKGLCIEDCQKIQSSHFRKLSSLEYLQIKSCPQLQSLPPNFGKLSSLEILNIKSCPQLQSLPTDFHKLSSLKELYIKDCPQLQSLPADFHKLSSLKSLCVKRCPKIQSLPPHFQKLSFLDYLLHIKSCAQLQSLPPSFGNLSSLENLNIKSCPELQSLPADLYKFSSLKSLCIEDCSKIQSLPPDFHKLSSLEELSIIDCSQLQSMPADFHKLLSLKSLWIKHCPKIQSLPPDFHKLSSLKSLRIEDCPKIQPLTPDFHKLSSLKCLGIINEITSTRLEDCPQLQSLKDSIKSLVIAYQMPREERCKLESGHYWHQIKHIPEIDLTTGQHNYIRFLPGVPAEYSIEEEDEAEEEEENQDDDHSDDDNNDKDEDNDDQDDFVDTPEEFNE